LRDQLLGALECLASHLAVGVGLDDLRLQLGIIYLEERRARVNFLAFTHQDLRDASLHLGPQLDGLHGLDLARRSDGVHHRVADSGRDFDGHGEAAGTTGRRRFRLVAGGEQYDQHNR